MDKAQRKWLEDRRSQLTEKGQDPEPDNTKYAWIKDFGQGIMVSCGRGRYFRIEGSDFKKRYTSLRFSYPGQQDAQALFFEWGATGFVDPTIFLDVADSNSQEDYEMAAAIGECWGDDYEHPLDYGSIVVFHRLVIPCPMPGFWETMRSAIKREFSRRASMMVLKAFPLEWENRFQDPGAPGQDAFERRLRAMTKHYRRKLDVSPMPVSEGLGEWLWMPIRFDEPPEGGTVVRSAYPS